MLLILQWLNFIFNLSVESLNCISQKQLVLCSVKSITFLGICAERNYVFLPVQAGKVIVDDATAEATLMLNDDLGVDTPVELVGAGTFGTYL